MTRPIPYEEHHMTRTPTAAERATAIAAQHDLSPGWDSYMNTWKGHVDGCNWSGVILVTDTGDAFLDIRKNGDTVIASGPYTMTEMHEDTDVVAYRNALLDAGWTPCIEHREPATPEQRLAGAIRCLLDDITSQVEADDVCPGGPAPRWLDDMSIRLNALKEAYLIVTGTEWEDNA
jgi:hypothetical protein